MATCSTCKKEVADTHFFEDKQLCTNCFFKTVKRVKTLTEEHMKVLKGPDKDKFPKEVLTKKIAEEKKRLHWCKEQLKLLKNKLKESA
ncbi:MAG: hypothetical protein ACFFCS_19880 [Candidatus Hodarchaeota archaeon]